MGLRLRAALLMALMAAAAFTGAEAWRSLRAPEDKNLPHEIYDSFAERAEGAVCYLRESGGYVAVFETGRSREPLRVTRIELKCLRAADRAMVEAGIPVLSRQELLQLLEDLGS
ncbi:MAG: hypothetical protein IIU18_03420 [Oscillospiraceae bacterium]|nr:hypothetical protein [Oscillospiraceae bacterium]